MQKQAWAMFWFVALIWGSSFLLIRVGVAEVPPSQVVFIRTLIAALGLNAVLFLRGMRLPTDWATWRVLSVVGVGNASLPYLLFATGEMTVPSNVASVLQATTALFGLVIAHFYFDDERITPARALGLGLGFIGVLMLAIRPQDETGDGGNIGGMVLIVMGALSYAIFTAYARRKTMINANLAPMVVSAGSFIAAAISAFVFMLLEPVFGGQAAVGLHTLSQDVLFAILMLGFINTFVAYLFYYTIVKVLGVARASMITYVVPVVGMILGWLILDESIDLMLIVGMVLILSGIALSNLQLPAAWRRKNAG